MARCDTRTRVSASASRSAAGHPRKPWSNRAPLIEPGMIADIVILDADPSENIAVLGDPAHVCAVIKDGKPIDLAS
jgi:hypothetical protein